MKTVSANKQALYSYSISQKILAGIVLSGQEVKSIKSGGCSLKGSYVRIISDEAFLVNAHISPYKQASNLEDYNVTADRKLLLTRSELKHIAEATHSEGKTIVPLRIGLLRGLVKVEIAIAKGKKRYDKREVIKKRDMLRDASRDVKTKK